MAKSPTQLKEELNTVTIRLNCVEAEIQLKVTEAKNLYMQKQQLEQQIRSLP